MKRNRAFSSPILVVPDDNPGLTGSRVYHKTFDFDQKLFDNPQKQEGKQSKIKVKTPCLACLSYRGNMRVYKTIHLKCLSPHFLPQWFS